MPIKTVNAITLKEWIREDKAIVIDVREPEEHQANNIPNSILIPLGTISKKLLPKNDKKHIVIHCLSGSRSNKAVEKLLAEDSQLDLYNLAGGISEWDKLENPSKISIDRQVHITVGCAVLITSILGHFISPVFLLLTGFFGAGLMFSGLSNLCLLGILLARMPWNKSSKP